MTRDGEEMREDGSSDLGKFADRLKRDKSDRLSARDYRGGGPLFGVAAPTSACYAPAERRYHQRER